MKFAILLGFLFIIQVDLRRQKENNDLYELDNLYNREKSDSSSSFQREKKYPSRKKILEDGDNGDEPEKPVHHAHSSKTSNRTILSNTPKTTTQQNYIEEASLCINEFDIKTEQLVKVKELKDGARMLRFVHVDEPTSSHGLDIKDICMLNCCVEKYCDLAMLSEQRTKVSLIPCYEFNIRISMYF
jgi:hypothetical protein